MNGLRRRGVRLLSAIFFAALLLVPLAERGHSHVDRDLAKPCPVCAVAHHTPAAIAPVVAVGASAILVSFALVHAVDSPTPHARSPRRGRAPPASFHIAVV